LCFCLRVAVKGEKLVVFGSGRERLYTRERAKALARKITCELLTVAASLRPSLPCLSRLCQPGTSVHGYMWTASLFVTCLLILVVYIIALCSSINTITFISLCVRCYPVPDLTVMSPVSPHHAAILKQDCSFFITVHTLLYTLFLCLVVALSKVSYANFDIISHIFSAD
jgi:hypothetical protein